MRYAAILLLLSAGGLAVACPPRARVCAPVHAVPAAVPVVVAPAPYIAPVYPVIVPIAVYQPIVVTIPSYSATYIPPVVAPAAAPAPAPAAPVPPSSVPAPAAAPMVPGVPPMPGATGAASPVPAAPAAAPATKVGTATELLTSRCLSCHGGDRPKGGFRMFGVAGELMSSVHKGKVYRETQELRMPLGADGKPAPLSDEEMSVIRKWLSE